MADNRTASQWEVLLGPIRGYSGNITSVGVGKQRKGVAHQWLLTREQLVEPTSFHREGVGTKRQHRTVTSTSTGMAMGSTSTSRS